MISEMSDNSSSENGGSQKSATKTSHSQIQFPTAPANAWIIGDVHGCQKTLSALILEIEEHDPNPTFVFIGDLVGKGPDSLGVLDFLMNQPDRVSVLLGNHDLHLLACSYGITKPRSSDMTQSILDLSQHHGWRKWLQNQDLVMEILSNQQRFRLVHAGIHPQWNDQELSQRIQEACALIRTDDWSWYKNKTSKEWETVSTLTRIRCIQTSDFKPKYDYTGSPSDVPEDLSPWFKALPQRNQQAEQLTGAESEQKPHYIFGHWARLGVHKDENATCIDSGCVYGGELTAYQPSTGQILHIPTHESPS